jgi:hypothetical protein
MNNLKHYIGCICILLSVSIYGQNQNEIVFLNNAQRELEKGNYESSLDYLNALSGTKLNDDVLAIKSLWLLSENYVELEYPEESILENLRAIYSIDPLFTKEKYNLDVSSRVENRLQTISIYPNWVLSVNASKDYIIPVVKKEPYICPECVSSDSYSFSELGSNFNINLAYYFKNNYGLESGIGYATATYSRIIQSESSGDEYTVSYEEKLQLIDFPIRYIIEGNKWSIRIGANYKYLVQSNAKIYHTYLNNSGDQIRQEYTRDDLSEIRNRNLFFLGFNIDRKIYPTKGKSLWFLSLNLNAQMGLNSFIAKENRLSDINFISDTYYTDDSIKLAMIGLGLRFNYNANFKIH